MIPGTRFSIVCTRVPGCFSAHTLNCGHDFASYTAWVCNLEPGSLHFLRPRQLVCSYLHLKNYLRFQPHLNTSFFWSGTGYFLYVNSLQAITLCIFLPRFGRIPHQKHMRTYKLILIKKKEEFDERPEESGKTENEIKNYWNTRIKKKLKQMGAQALKWGFGWAKQEHNHLPSP